MARQDGRDAHELRSVDIQVGFHRIAEGSVLYRAGGTVVLCTVSIEDKVPAFLEASGKGWLTAEYQMHPRANPRRQERDGRNRPLGGRTQEIQRLIGRALRTGVHLDRIGRRTITIDCDVLEADGGTRTAAITGGSVALALAVHRLTGQGALTVPVLRPLVAATSVGIVDGLGILVDLAYSEDSRAQVDLNIVATERLDIVEVQGTAETDPIARKELDQMLDVGLAAIKKLGQLQRQTLVQAGVTLKDLIAE